jgi:hypothetical protein
MTALGTRIANRYGYRSGQTSAQVGFTTGDVADWAFATTGSLAFGVEFDGGFVPQDGELDQLTERTYQSIRDIAAGMPDPAGWTAPQMTDVVASATRSPLGMRAVVTATVSAASTPGDSIASVELSTGRAGGTRLIQMTPADGTFDSVFETATAVLDLPPGRHEIWVRARSRSGRVGVPGATVATLLPVQVWIPVALTR